MAGFLGMGNYAKVGKGVKKSEQSKRRFFEFFDIFFRKFFNLIKLNLLYVLFCIPIVTIGGATAALFKIAKLYHEGKPVFLFSDFFESFKSCFWQGLIMSIINAGLIFACIQSFIFYYTQTYLNLWYYLPLALIGFVSLTLIFAGFYSYILISSVNLSMYAVLKNSLMLAFLGTKTNFLTLLFTGIIVVPSLLYYPFTTPLFIVFVFSFSAFITSFNSFQYVYKYVIRPYYFTNNLPDPYEDSEVEAEMIFNDAT